MLIGQSVCAAQNWFARLSKIYMMKAEMNVEKYNNYIIGTYRIGIRSTFHD